MTAKRGSFILDKLAFGYPVVYAYKIVEWFEWKRCSRERSTICIHEQPGFQYLEVLRTLVNPVQHQHGWWRTVISYYINVCH